jgi:hypothetical protein
MAERVKVAAHALRSAGKTMTNLVMKG